jgi:protein-L-isoaspartate(D-aspartate) O-methyltransferase
MVEQQLRSRGIHDKRVLDAFLRVPRHYFVPPAELSEAYADYPLPIGEGQTISQPWIVAYMLQELKLTGGKEGPAFVPADRNYGGQAGSAPSGPTKPWQSRVLDVGTGSGYQAALLAEMGCEVYAIERIPSLMEKARAVIDSLGYTRVHYHIGDGTLGWSEHAPYDRIVVGAAAPATPPSLVAQLAEGGCMVLPVGGISGQELVRIEKRGGKAREVPLCGCVFVRLIGKEGW